MIPITLRQRTVSAAADEAMAEASKALPVTSISRFVRSQHRSKIVMTSSCV
jgi:hypothetical protein